MESGAGTVIGRCGQDDQPLLSGRVEPRAGVFVDLLNVLRERREELTRLIAAVEAHVNAAGE